MTSASSVGTAMCLALDKAPQASVTSEASKSVLIGLNEPNIGDRNSIKREGGGREGRREGGREGRGEGEGRREGGRQGGGGRERGDSKKGRGRERQRDAERCREREKDEREGGR